MNEEMFYIITYDLKTEQKDYTSLYDAIKALGDWQHPLESTWVVSTTETDQNGIYERLKPCLDEVDHILIFQIYPKERQGWLGRSFWQWMRDKVEEEGL